MSDIRERSYKFVLMTVEYIDNLPTDITAQIIARQLFRASSSIGANIVEAQAAPSKKDFANFLNYSLKSANETKYWLELLRDSKKSGKIPVDPLIKEAGELAKILAASLITLRGKRHN